MKEAASWRIDLLVDGSAGEAVAVEVAALLTERLGATVGIRGTGAAGWAASSGGEQSDAGLVLEQIEALPDRGEVSVVLTEADLGTPVLEYVFGAARLGRGVAVVSVARLATVTSDPVEASRWFAVRVAKETLHEVGHALGLTHCRQSHCVMRLAHVPSQVDERGSDFCPACRDRIDEAIGRDVARGEGER